MSQLNYRWNPIWKGKDYQREISVFKYCHVRVRIGQITSIKWNRDWKGFLEFIEEIGNVPAGIKRLAVGFKDKHKGYANGNIFWTEAVTGRPSGSKNKNPYPAGSHIKRCQTMGIETWEGRGHEKEIAAFKRCHNRVRDGKVKCIQWSRNWKGFLAFLEEMGPYPEDMQKPSVGRKNHAKGYVKGNIAWQEHIENSPIRKGTRYESIAYPTRPRRT